MKRSQLIPVALFLALTFWAVPQASFAGTSSTSPGAIHTSDPEPRSYNTPNLDKQDGFDAVAHKEKLQSKPRQVKQFTSDKPLDKHNL
ncbi:MAG: hypothetical protein AAF564_03580 [Bacteroidota bacterium]